MKDVAGLSNEFSNSGIEELPFGHILPATEKGHKSWEFNKMHYETFSRLGILIKIESHTVQGQEVGHPH